MIRASHLGASRAEGEGDARACLAATGRVAMWSAVLCGARRLNRRRGKRLDNWRLAPKNEGNECPLRHPCTFMTVCMCNTCHLPFKKIN